MTTTFESLGVPADLVTVLAAQGITEPFPIQALTIADARAGRDVCGKAKTGSGKTLAFGLPLLERTEKAEPRRPRSLVLVPTRELAVQVHDVLAPLAEATGVSLVAIYGGSRMQDQVRPLKDGVDVVVATPGRLIDLVDRSELSLADVGLVVLDEADRMADMGFTPQVEWLLRHIEQPHQTLLFSATLDREVDHLVRRYQKDPVFHEVQSATQTVEDMHHRYLAVHEMDKAKVVAAIARHQTRTLVFARTKRGVDRLTRQLRDDGVRAGAIHGDLRQEVRQRALAQFAAGKLPILVATDVAARGLHVEGIDIVIHYDPPEDHKTYLHRSGRTARAGEEGLVVTLVLWNQHAEAERMQKRLGIKQPIVEMFSNDPRLADLTSWDPTSNSAAS
jgi:superfamily II DNA/RNA helicase